MKPSSTGRGAVASVLLAIVISSGFVGAPAQGDPTREILARGLFGPQRETLDKLEAGSSTDTAVAPTTIGVIARPSIADAIDSAAVFNNNEGTLSLVVAPFALFDPWSDATPWQLGSAKLTLSANTEQKNLTVGGRWDYTEKDPRVYFGPRLDQISAKLDAKYKTCNAEDACLNNALNSVVDEELKSAAASPFGVTVAGNATYDNNGSYDGSTATLVAEWEFALAENGKIPLTGNLKWEDARPVDATQSDTNRDRQVGGGLQLAYEHQLAIAGRSDPLGFGLGFGITALACVQDDCTNDDATLRFNPFVSIGITKSIGARLDVVWEGDGANLRDAVGGIKLDYSFSGL